MTDGSSRHGCLKWYWEEPRPVDTNAAFFTGLNLIVLQLGFPDQLERLDADARATLEAILTDLSVWFDRTLAHPSRYYPNKYMGDLVCRWLLLEALGQQAERQRVAGEGRPGDRVLVMSNGGFQGIHQRLLDALGARGEPS